MDDDESPPSDDESNAPRDLSTAVEASADALVATGSLFAAIHGHPELGIPMALTGPFLTGFVTTRQRQKVQAAALSVAETARVTGEPPQALLDAMEGDDRRMRLGSEVVNAAAETLYVDKLIALGRCLAAGLTDDAALDTEWLVARALADLEEPHVLALHALTGWRDDGGVPMTTVPTPHLGLALAEWITTTTMPTILTTLQRHGLIDPVPSIIGVTSQTVNGSWVVTPFGREVLKRIESAAPKRDAR